MKINIKKAPVKILGRSDVFSAFYADFSLSQISDYHHFNFHEVCVSLDYIALWHEVYS